MPHFTPDLANPHSRGWGGGNHSPWRNSRGWLCLLLWLAVAVSVLPPASSAARRG